MLTSEEAKGLQACVFSPPRRVFEIDNSIHLVKDAPAETAGGEHKLNSLGKTPMLAIYSPSE